MSSIIISIWSIKLSFERRNYWLVVLVSYKQPCLCVFFIFIVFVRKNYFLTLWKTFSGHQTLGIIKVHLATMLAELFWKLHENGGNYLHKIFTIEGAILQRQDCENLKLAILLQMFPWIYKFLWICRSSRDTNINSF